MSFFEEVALLLRAHLISDALACYMFGYYALLCNESDTFWSDVLVKDQWPLFSSFVDQMASVKRLKEQNKPAFVSDLTA